MEKAGDGRCNSEETRHTGGAISGKNTAGLLEVTFADIRIGSSTTG